MHKPFVPALGGLALLAAVGLTVVIDTCEMAQAQTVGMSRRADRRGDRQAGRQAKHACNASGASSRSGCRNAKRDVKQAGRAGRW